MLVDFDDCLMGPPVQDLWLLARGDDEEAKKGREDLLEGYEVFREFDRSTLGARRAPPRDAHRLHVGLDRPAVGGSVVPPAFPSFRDHRYWMQEYEELVRIAETLG